MNLVGAEGVSGGNAGRHDNCIQMNMFREGIG